MYIAKLPRRKQVRPVCQTKGKQRSACADESTARRSPWRTTYTSKSDLRKQVQSVSIHARVFLLVVYSIEIATLKADWIKLFQPDTLLCLGINFPPTFLCVNCALFTCPSCFHSVPVCSLEVCQLPVLPVRSGLGLRSDGTLDLSFKMVLKATLRWREIPHRSVALRNGTLQQMRTTPPPTSYTVMYSHSHTHRLTGKDNTKPTQSILKLSII